LIGLQALLQIHSQEAKADRNTPRCEKSWMPNSVSMVLQIGAGPVAAKQQYQPLQNRFSVSKKNSLLR